MRIFKIILKTIGIFLAIIFVIGLVLYFQQKPVYEGQIQLNGIGNETSVYFDDYGIPHIYAENEVDAMIALGYVHAQDRLWQMELLRRIAPGKLSEIFGEDMLETDRFFAALGIEEASKKTIDSLNTASKSYQLAQAYLKGINQFIDEGATPVEFLLLGLKKNHFEIKDIYNTLGYMSFSFAMAQKTDPLLSLLHQKLGNSYMNELQLGTNLTTTTIKNSPEMLQNISEIAHQIFEKTPVSSFIGSNSWVIGAEKTQHQKVIFANDPHIGFSQPAVWYEAHITTPQHEIYGFYIAGVPFPLLGHNHQYAYGLTMFENDDIDFYEEETHPTDSTLYRFKDGWKKYEFTQKTIAIKGKSSKKLMVKSTHHGPIVSGIAKNISRDKPVSMFWVYTQQPNLMLDVCFEMSRTTSITDFKKGVSKIHAPGLNVMYGDAQGNIAWWASGKLYTYPKETNRNYFLNGADGEQEMERYLDFSENPQAINPKWNYVYSANNQPDLLYPGYYLPEDRAKRIVDLLENKNDWNQASVSNMITDVTSPTAPNFVKEFLKTIPTKGLTENQQKAVEMLKEWKGDFQLNGIAPTIYTKMIYNYLKFTFEDEMGKETFDKLLNTHFMKVEIGHHLMKNESPWWDDIKTEIRENKAIILNKSFTSAILSLEKQLGSNINKWTWNKVHTLEHPHAMGKIALLRPFFNVGPFEINGSSEVINNLQFPLTDDGLYKVNAGPSSRRVIDFSDVENAVNISPTGQSGNIFSKHYADQSKMYVNNQFRKMKLNKEDIIKTSKKLVILPKK
ncbi:MAG: penicillin acylase family protein [Flavobacteriaceae bacterium]|nr:penicillin acylase family protein [Flavobacteriaceae bacterium]